MADSGLESDVSSFGQATDGTLYVLSLADGVFRVDAAADSTLIVGPTQSKTTVCRP